MNGSTSLDTTTAVLLAIAFAVTTIFIIVPMVIINWVLMKKAGKPGWTQLIPAYSYYVQGVVAGRRTIGTWIAVLYGLDLVSIVTPASAIVGDLVGLPIFILWIIMIVSLAKKYNAGAGMWVLFILVPVVGVFFVNKYQYIGAGTTPTVAPMAPQPGIVATPPVAAPVVPQAMPVAPAPPGSPRLTTATDRTTNGLAIIVDDKLYRSSAGGVIVKDGRVLTIQWRSKDSVEFPKGTIEPGETAPQTAVREVKEETGYDVEIIDDLGTITYEFDWTDGHHYVKTVTFYLMQLANDNPPQPNLQAGEDFENNWLSINEARIALTHDDSREILQRAMRSMHKNF